METILFLSVNTEDTICMTSIRSIPDTSFWIADKYEPHVKSEMRFKELAVTYSKIYLDLQTRKKYKMPVSRFVGTPGEKLSDLKLTITKVRN